MTLSNDPVGTLRSEITERLPEYDRSASQMRRELATYAAQVCGAARPGVGILMMQTANDFSDLLTDLGMGRGRPAMRCLRSIFESLITMLDIADQDSDAEEKYEEHYAVAKYQAATIQAGLTGLTGNALKAERHRRHKEQRDHKHAHDEAIQKRGVHFGRNWAGQTLRDRATRHGYADDYDLYRLASFSVHISAGGARGIERSYGGVPVHRFGPDLLDCPLAFNEGLRYFKHFIEALSCSTKADAERVLLALAELESLREPYRKLVSRIDNDLWPETLPIGPVVVRALLPDGTRKWLLHDNGQRRIIECRQPDNATRKQLERTERLLDEVNESGSKRDEWVTVAILYANADPLPNAHWRPDGHLVPLDWNPWSLMLPWDQ